MNTAKSYSSGKIVRPLLLMLLHFCIVCEAAWCQAGPPPPYWSAAPRYKLSPSPNFWPQSDRPVRSAKPKAVSVQIPEPENVTIGEEYAKGSIVIINHERKLYFVEEVGNAVRYPVAIGSPADEWQGVQTITAKRENPTWYPPMDIQIETDCSNGCSSGAAQSARSKGFVSRRYAVSNPWHESTGFDRRGRVTRLFSNV
jgi:hypothetical protein